MGNEAKDVLEDIFLDIWHIDMRSNNELHREKLLGRRINMAARDLVILLFAIEERIHIRIDKVSIIEGKFDTFQHIMELIYNALS